MTRRQAVRRTAARRWLQAVRAEQAGPGVPRTHGGRRRPMACDSQRRRCVERRIAAQRAAHLAARRSNGPARHCSFATASQDETFVFNQSGQELDVEGLISICRYDGLRTIPLGTPVKDSQFAKVVVGDRHVWACLFAPRSAVSAAMLGRWSNELAEGFARWCWQARTCTCGWNHRSGDATGSDVRQVRWRRHVQVRP